MFALRRKGEVKDGVKSERAKSSSPAIFKSFAISKALSPKLHLKRRQKENATQSTQHRSRIHFSLKRLKPDEWFSKITLMRFRVVDGWRLRNWKLWLSVLVMRRSNRVSRGIARCYSVLSKAAFTLDSTRLFSLNKRNISVNPEIGDWMFGWNHSARHNWKDEEIEADWKLIVQRQKRDEPCNSSTPISSE